MTIEPTGGGAWSLSPSDVFYVWHADLRTDQALAGLRTLGLEPRALIVWSKPHFTVGRGNYQWQHELCWYAVRKGAKARWIGGRKQGTVWQIGLSASAGDHGTQKPVECMERPIRNHDAPEVYDPFVGSGTTIVAAQRANRRCFAMEIDPAYCDQALRRWQELTEERPVLARTGKPVDFVRGRR